MKLLVATTNSGKISELTELLNETEITLLSLNDYPDLPDVIEDGSTFLENALKKARTAASYSGQAALADDSGLEVDALDGNPGVLSARFGPTSEARNNKLLAMLDSVPDSGRTARFVCALAFVRQDGFEWSTEGVCEGRIIREPRGDRGFGYDPVFYYETLGKTFAELSREEKNDVSHRGQALRAFKEAVEKRACLFEL